MKKPAPRKKTRSTKLADLVQLDNQVLLNIYTTPFNQYTEEFKLEILYEHRRKTDNKLIWPIKDPSDNKDDKEEEKDDNNDENHEVNQEGIL